MWRAALQVRLDTNQSTGYAGDTVKAWAFVIRGEELRKGIERK